jgi:hypothetical protein
MGKCVSVLVNIPSDSFDYNKADIMGYGVALPSRYILGLLKLENATKLLVNDNRFWKIKE